MYTYDQVEKGLEKFINIEILNKIPGWKKWVLGAGIDMAIQNGEHIFNELKCHPVIKMLNIVDDTDYINVDDLHKSLRKQAEHGPITFELPVIGILTLNTMDVDKVYAYIIED